MFIKKGEDRAKEIVLAMTTAPHIAAPNTAPSTANAQAAPRLSAEARVALAWSDMRQEMLRQLWQAALGDAEGSAPGSGGAPGVSAFSAQLGIDPAILLALQGSTGALEHVRPSPEDASFPAPASSGSGAASASQGFRSSGASGALDLEGNAIYQPYLEGAAARTGLSAAMLAAIVSAEAATRDGVWNPNSRNPRSTAAGLTQFLASTWESETERPGTWLNGIAHERGWLDANGKVRAAAREDLLALRFDPRASIEAAADYAHANLSALEKQGLVPGGLSDGELAKRAYLAHHLGVGDAARFLTKGLSSARARVLLASQIGGGAAASHIQAAGNAADAHRQWLTAYVDRKIRVEDHQRHTITV